MRFLQIITSVNTTPIADPRSATPDPKHTTRVGAVIEDAIASGELVATGVLGKRATSAARLTYQAGEISVEDPPRGEGWMTGRGYSLVDVASKEEAIAKAKQQLEAIGEAVIELIQVSEVHPPPSRAPQPAGAQTLPQGVIPYLTFEGNATEAAAFYQKAFAAKQLAHVLAQDGKRVMHGYLEINGGGLMLSDNFPEMGLPPVQRSGSYTMQLVVADGDTWWQRAVAAGCKEKMPFALAPWGDNYGQLVDPFGVTWAISSPPQR
jgi:uncharacterized glyoxalase superfamily protein PhnB